VSAPGFRRAGANAAFAILIGTTLSGCAVLGSNVKGSFSCAAPDGICAPTSTIDDRALALITGEAGGASTSPAGPYQETPQRAPMRRVAAAGSAADSKVGAGRTQERVLRIVFQPYIDGRGRLHEASAVHAVVHPGEWQSEAIASATPIPDAHASAVRQEPSLAEMVDRLDTPATLASIDPNLPDPAAGAAARTRKADPVGAIKADVAARLEARPGRVVAPLATKPPLAVGKDQPAAPPTQAAGGAQPPKSPRQAKQVSAVVPPSTLAAGGTTAAVREKTRDPGPAQARVKADPQYRAAAEEAQRTAQQAAGSVLPEVKAPIGPTVRAAAFPAVVTEDN